MKTVNSSVKNFIFVLCFAAAILTMTQCATKTAPAIELPKDLMGISIGMSKDAAQKRLQEIAQLESEGRKVGQLWQLKDNSRFQHLAVGYSKENQVRFVTGLVDKEKVRERIRFADVGDLSQAKPDINEPHYRYTWKVSGTDGRPSYFVTIYGDNKDFLTIYSLATKPGIDEE